MVISACCFGTISPLTVVATGRGMALESIQSWRYATSALLLLAIGAVTRRPGTTPDGAAAGLSPWYHPRTLLLAGAGQALVATLALAALRWLPAATASFLFYTFPAWVAIITAVRGIERIDRTRVVALVLALGGIATMVGTPGAGAMPPVGVAVILAAAVVYALYIPLLGHLQQHRDSLDVSRAIAVGGTLLFTAWAAARGTLLEIPDVTAFLASIAQGVLSTGSFLGFLMGLRLLGPVRAAITSTVEPFWTTLLGIVMLGQPIGAGTVIGGVAIMGAVLLLQRRPSPST